MRTAVEASPEVEYHAEASDGSFSLDIVMRLLNCVSRSSRGFGQIVANMSCSIHLDETLEHVTAVQVNSFVTPLIFITCLKIVLCASLRTQTCQAHFFESAPL